MHNLKNYITTITEFSESSWRILQDCFTESTLKRKEYLLAEGEVCRAIFYISSGLCRCYYNRDGQEVNTAFHFEGEFVTNNKSLKSSERSEYAIQAYEPCTVVTFEKEKLLEAYKQCREIETFGRLVLESITMQQQEHADSFKLLTPKERFSRLTAARPRFFAANFAHTSRIIPGN